MKFGLICLYAFWAEWWIESGRVEKYSPFGLVVPLLGIIPLTMLCVVL